MTLAPDLLRDAAIGVSISATPEGLSAIHRPGCAAAIWQRQPLDSFQWWIDRLEPALLPRARIILRPELVRDAVLQVCDTCGTPASPERARLIDDIAALADIFATVMGARYLRLRLDVVNTDACRKFHIDAATARLVCTYRGTGTQYATGKQDRTGAGSALTGRMFTLPTGAPILLRGTLWREHPAAGLLHRLPPIAGTGQTRLVLVLDPVDDPADAA